MPTVFVSDCYSFYSCYPLKRIFYFFSGIVVKNLEINKNLAISSLTITLLQGLNLFIFSGMIHILNGQLKYYEKKNIH